MKKKIWYVTLFFLASVVFIGVDMELLIISIKQSIAFSFDEICLLLLFFFNERNKNPFEVSTRKNLILGHKKKFSD